MGALFPIVCPFCRAKTAAAPEAFVRWRPEGGRSEAAESLQRQAQTPATAPGVFSAVCPACDKPLFLELVVRGEVLLDLLPRERTPPRRAVAQLQPSEVLKYEVVGPRPPPGPALPPSVPEQFSSRLQPLWEDAHKGRNAEGVGAACRWLLLDVLKDIGAPASPRRMFACKSEDEAIGPRLKAACAAGLLPKWAETRAKAIDVEGKARSRDPKAQVDYVAAVLRAAYPGF